MFSGSTILVAVLPVSWAVDMLEIKDGSQITGSSNNFAGFTDARRSKTNTGIYEYVRKMHMASSHGRRYLVPKIQDSGQRIRSSNISETMKHIIKIPTANLRHSTTANSQEVYLGDSNNERQSQMAEETGNLNLNLNQSQFIWQQQ